MKKSLFAMMLLLLAFASDSFCKDRAKNEKSRTSGLEWKELVPMRHYSLEEVVSLMENTPDLAVGGIRVGAYYFCARKVAKEPAYKVKKYGNNSIRLLFTLELRNEDGSYLLDSVCADSCKKDFESMIITNGKAAALQVQDEGGKHFLLFSEQMIEDIGLADIGDKEISAGGFDASFSALIDDADFYFWDRKTKSMWCYVPKEKRVVDLYNTLEEPFFYYPDDAYAGFANTKPLFVSENSSKSPRFGAVWQCQKHSLSRVK